MAELSEILAKLLQRTNDNKIDWQPTATKNNFKAVFGGLSVTIDLDVDGDPFLRILNKSGIEIERLICLNTGSHWKSDMNELYRKAKRLAAGVDRQLDELLRELEKGA